MARNLQHISYQYPDIKVLLVEEEGFFREKLLRILQRRFSAIYVAKDDLEGLKFYQQYQPDLIIAELNLVELSQLEMIQRIRELNTNVQVILTTHEEHDDDPYIQKIRQNANHIILKPLDLDVFFQAIQSSIDQIQLAKEIQRHEHSFNSVTSGMNRMKFYELLRNVLKRSKQWDEPLAIIKIGIDLCTNDSLGKEAADKVLHTIITIIQQKIGEKDIFERWERGEFLLLLPDSSIMDAVHMAESLHSLIVSFDFEGLGHVSCSFGVTGYPNTQSATELLSEADFALNKSKSNGSSRITIYRKDH